MKKLLLTLVLLSWMATAYCQYDFLFKRKSLTEIRTYEDSIHSKNLGYVKTNVAKDYFPTAVDKHDYYPISYLRTNDHFFPELHVKYFYNETDSTLLASSYDWDIMDYVSNVKKDGDKFEIEKKRKKEYLAKYKEIYNYLVNQLGKPESVNESHNESGYFYKVTWKKDNIDVILLFKFSTQLIDLPGDMKIGSFDIRVKVDYNK